MTRPTTPGADPRRRPAGRRWSHRQAILVRAAIAGALLVPFGAAVALAHPLGNFTINHHAGIRVEPDRIVLDIVIDEAEIPTFQATEQLDQDADGELSADEMDAARSDGCRSVAATLTLDVAGRPARLRLIDAGVTFPPGNGGLSTMRLVCTLEAPLAATLAAPTAISFRDDFEASRLGWREITVVGDRATVSGDGLTTVSTSNRLTSYPTGLTGAPDVRSVAFSAAPGGSALPPFSVPDATPIGPIEIGGAASSGAGSVPSAAPAVTGAAIAPEAAAPGATAPGGVDEPAATPAAIAATGGGPVPAAVGSTGSAGGSGDSPAVAAVPGGEGAIPDILRTSPVTPLLALVAFLTAALLGAGHAVTPGHGKTLMAAYLVGTRGTPRHALGLGLAVSVSHTFGILALAVIVVGAASTLPPDLVVRVAPLVAAVTIVAIGGWMLVTEIRRGLAARRAIDRGAANGHTHPHGTAPEAPHEHDHDHAHAAGLPHDHDDVHDPAPPDAAGGDVVTHAGSSDGLEHSHGGVAHRHVPPAGATITWRSLFILGLAGGLIPSTNALLILLATIASGRPAWGVVLVVAFGLGMAAVMAGVGLAFVHARGLLERAPSRTRLARAARFVPLGAAVLVLGFGVVLTSQAIAAAPFR